MKKVLIALALVFMVAMSNAQWVSSKTIATFNPASANFFNYTGTLATDSISLVANPIYRVIDLRRAPGLVDYVISYTVTKSAGTPEDYRVSIEGSADGTTYVRLKTFLTTDVASVTKVFTSVDTLTNVVAYPYLRVNAVGDGETTSRAYISNISGKVVTHIGK